ncbi:MAG: hypothetical protein ACFE0I_09330 [Elainellaceae cyanobacterium]
MYVSQHDTSRRAGQANPRDGLFPDPAIVYAARHIYHDFCEVHPSQAQRPLGVAIDRFTYRGQIIFTDRPVLLPQECFVPIQHILTH